MASADEVATSVDRFGDRYLRRVYTSREVATCTGRHGLSTERLAARFAAKESVVKALRPTGGVAFHDVEVQLDESGAPEVVLSGRLREHAAELGVVDTSLSLTHDDGRAGAVFVAVLASPLPSHSSSEIIHEPAGSPLHDPLTPISELIPAPFAEEAS